MKSTLAAFALMLTAAPSSAAIVTFASAAPIAIPAAFSLKAESLVVGGLTAPVTGLTVSLNGLSHDRPDALIFGLANETAGVGFMFFSGAGGSTGVSNIDLTFSDAGAATLPDPLVSGTYRPANNLAASFFFTIATSLNDLGSYNPNGVWQLYILNQPPGGAGTLSGGFSLAFTVGGAAAVVPEPANWALMIAGFGLIGGALRARRRETATA